MDSNEAEMKAEQLFAELLKTTKCPFATRAQIQHGTTWTENTNFGDHVLTWANELRIFVTDINYIKSDGIILAGYGKQVPQNLDTLAQFVLRLLSELTKLDRGTAITPTEVEEPGWQFSFCGTRMFLVTFASLYQPNNPRHSPVHDTVFIFLQPESSFDRFMPYSEHDPRARRLKKNIRQDFAEAGMPYNEKIVDNSSEAFKYVKPHNPGDPPIMWWK